ncbi:MAG TPA: XrtA system polysaccharide chain length determinant [Burkholderiales bacterium]|nr:XrtA system polysaccharide chain length determinant [Burkholderiales bacterium]
MHELIQQAVTVLRGMWQWRWLGLAVAWIVGIVAAGVVFVLPNQYEASARIWVDTQSVLKPLMSGLAVQPNVDQQIGMLSRTLINRPNMEKLVRMADLDLSIKSKEEQEALIDRLMKTLEIKGLGRDNLFTLAFRDPEPEKAKRVVQSLTSIFVESSLGNKRRDTDTARQFIEDQIKIYEGKLTEAENRLKEFKLKNLSSGTGDGKDAFGRIGELELAMNQARLALREAEQSRDAIRQQLASESPNLPLPQDAKGEATVPEIDARLDALKKNLDLLLQRYTDKHPDVAGTRRVIAELEAQKRDELAARKAAEKSAPAAPVAPAATNPVYQKLKMSLAEAEATVASLRTRVAEHEARYARFKASINMMPEIEAEYAQLNRDYDINKKNYETLVSRRESAAISGQMDQSAAIAEFRLIDPPRVSPQPVAPNRLLLVALALAGALAAGLAASFAASQIRPSVPDAFTLRELTGLTVLGTISYFVSEPLRRKERRSKIAFIGGLASLVIAFGIVIAFVFITGSRAVIA